jgi:hypothetical protein
MRAYISDISPLDISDICSTIALGSKMMDAWRKMEWSMCRKEDLTKFQMDLFVYTQSIELLLMAIQTGAMRIEVRGMRIAIGP